MTAFRILEQDGPTLLLEIVLQTARLEVITSVRLSGSTVMLYDFHIDGPGAGTLGAGAILDLVRLAKEHFGVDDLEIHGFQRTTGANPGRKPDVLRFRRR